MKKLLGIIVLGLLFNFYISVQAQNLPKNYLKGKFYNSIKNYFLVATKKMTDPRFKNTVIIMLENNEKGAWGIVINKPLTLIPLGSLINKPRDATNKQKELYNVKIPVYWGGPVNENNILILHSHEYKNETTTNYKNISISSDYNILFDIADNKGPKKNLVIVGISSWGEGQLEGEMEREGWILSEINLNLIFEMDNAEKWLNATKNSFIHL
jgi:putative transcriptional regulator